MSGGGGGLREICVPSSQYCSEPETALKIKSIFKENQPSSKLSTNMCNKINFKNNLNCSCQHHSILSYF